MTLASPGCARQRLPVRHAFLTPLTVAVHFFLEKGSHPLLAPVDPPTAGMWFGPDHSLHHVLQREWVIKGWAHDPSGAGWNQLSWDAESWLHPSAGCHAWIWCPQGPSHKPVCWCHSDGTLSGTYNWKGPNRCSFRPTSSLPPFLSFFFF